MKVRNQITQGLFFVMCLMLANSSFAAEGEIEYGPVVAVKRSTTVKLAEILERCVLTDKSYPNETGFECNVPDRRKLPTDQFEFGQRIITNTWLAAPPSPGDGSRGRVDVSVGGVGVRVWGTIYSSTGTLDDAKKLLTERFAKDALEGKVVEFYAHIVKSK